MQSPDLYCVIGNPIAHSRSPWIHARFAELTGQHLAYERVLAPEGGFARTLADLVARGLRGCNVTVPFKHDAAMAASTLSDRARLAGAANTLVLHPDGRVHADNTDGLGLVADIVHGAGVPLAGRAVLLLGAGGAAAGVLAPLIEQQPRRLVLSNRTHARAQTLVQRHADLAALQKVELLALEQQSLAQQGFDVVVNATASSLSGAALALPAQLLRPGALAYDMMYGPAAEGFLAWARAQGAAARDGLGMLVQQAAAAFALWRGVQPPAGQVLAELRSAMAAGTA
ncbi:shikimate dehydrogenase [Melaminivora suipulveris]|uniref:Shikimate dehydrogenase (NADP(+)) n=1 Tax=Melaminivora suipulveris TaxID=2109913 RepID=A0A2R3QDX1_9BURK|nr:shikimate dehydrogenase [Melaminivora suipulveris]AVO49874.1 shikimate dehydrogenase [Melaminivora suipulveris]